MSDPFTSEGLTISERMQIRTLNVEIARLLERSGANPRLSYAVLLNCLGSLIGTQMVEDAPALIQQAQNMLPLYVEAYRTKEKKLDE